jgi:hypothetical protein
MLLGKRASKPLMVCLCLFIVCTNMLQFTEA